MKHFFTILFAVCLTGLVYAQTTTVTFENLSLDSESFWNGSDESGSFQAGGISFLNWYNPEYFSWSGFSYSNITDNTTPGYINQYSAIPGSGADGSEIYAVHYHYMMDTSIVNIQSVVSGLYITNSTYTYFSMKDGDAFSKKFGGNDGTDPDWFKLTITGIDAEGNATGTVDFYLADFRFENSEDDYIINTWEWVDLTALGEVSKLAFSLSSTDMGDWGMNTPSYFALDNLTLQDAIPVELASFNAESDGSSVTLRWATATETNNAGFEVERRYDNKTFEKIAFVEGHGTTTENKYYTYNDNNVSGTVFYRLKQIDFDGTVTYSETIETNVLVADAYQLHQNYPNPFNPATTVSFTVPEMSEVNITVYAVDGSVVKEITDGVFSAGTHRATFQAHNLSSGVYMYRINATNMKTMESFQQTKSMLFVK